MLSDNGFDLVHTGWVPQEPPKMPDEYFDGIVDDYDPEIDDEDDDRTRFLTDYGNACRLVDAFGGDVRRCPKLPGDGWLIWDGRRWKVDDEDRIVRLAARVSLLLLKEAARSGEKAKKAEEDGDGDAAKNHAATAEAIEKWAKRSESRGAIWSMIDLAKSDPRVLVSKATLDGDRWLLNVQNGTIDLRTGKLRPHSRGDNITKLAPIDFDPLAPCPLFDGFLLRIMEGRRDMVEFLRRAVGYSLAGTIREQVFMVCHGDGSNGKGTLIGTLRDALGEYAVTSSPETFLKKRDGAIPNDLAALDGPRLVVASETEEGKPLDEQVVKSVTCGDRESLSARFLHAEWFEFHPQMTVWMLTNHKPIIKGTDKGIWRRIRLIPFLHDFETDPEKDVNFGERLIDTELPGVLAWAVRGCLEWQAGGLQEPDGVIEATQSYRQEMDIVSDFIDDELQHGPNAAIDNADLYKLFAEWCKANGEFVRSQRWLTRQMKRKGYHQCRTSVRTWEGICKQARTTYGGQAQSRWG